jgi:alkylated DNA repair dioxygenase AlkB
MDWLLINTRPPVEFFSNFLSCCDSISWFEKSRELKWSRGEINMYGKIIPVPREASLFGDDLHYAYRGATIKAARWPDFLLEARTRILKATGFKFAFAVGNRYLSGKDSIGWHSDDFPVIGKKPAIASLSLGSTRKFSGATFDYELESGSLLIMLPGCQDDWLHSVPKTARPVGERINWTFRPHVDAVL